MSSGGRLRRWNILGELIMIQSCAAAGRKLSYSGRGRAGVAVGKAGRHAGKGQGGMYL